MSFIADECPSFTNISARWIGEVRHNEKVVLELGATSVYLSTTDVMKIIQALDGALIAGGVERDLSEPRGTLCTQ